ncbi:MAG: hypothetical protein M1822_010052 [Bathelium mastoideum]|nr:MAG: hypothetical protein M1822_010052 [Bathelium mastoideum]
MGSGSEVAMEAADMVLLDSFAAIVEAVRYGRVVFDNLKKTICYLLPAGTFSEFWPIITSILFGMPQILSSFLMIIICCLTDCAAATAIAYEKPERDVLARKPRNMKKDRLVDWKLLLQAYGFLGIIMATCSFTLSYSYAERKGVPFSKLAFGFGKVPSGLSEDYYNQVLNEASSIYFINLFELTSSPRQFFNVLATRTRRLSLLQHPPIFRPETRNYKLFPAILFALGVAFTFLYVPKLQTVLNTSRIPIENFFLPLAFGMGLLLLDEARKAAVRKWPGKFLAKVAW